MAGRSFSPAAATSRLALMLVALVAMADSSSLSSFWQHELPHTAMPVSLEMLSSPLTPSAAHLFLARIKSHALQASDKEFCTPAMVYCSQKATVIPGSSTQPRVCIPPYFNYEYGMLPCRPGTVAMQQASAIFFTQGNLVKGQRVQLPDTTNDLKGLKFLHPSLAAALPQLEASNMPELASFYGVQEGSEMAVEMEQTLAHCGVKSEHEVRRCVATGEEMVSFVTSTVGHGAVVYVPAAGAKQGARVMDIATVRKEGRKLMSCHDMKFPSLVYSCHMTQSAELLEVTMKLDRGEIAQKLAVCHVDTSYWNPTHIAFQALHVEPGSTPICHWFPENSFIFVQA